MKCCAHVSQPYEEILAQRCGLCVGRIPAAASSRVMEAAGHTKFSLRGAGHVRLGLPCFTSLLRCSLTESLNKIHGA